MALTHDKRKEHRTLIGVIVCVVVIPLLGIGLHLTWPAVGWLRGIACGLVLVPVVVLLSTMFVWFTKPNGGSIVNGWCVILPILGGIFGVDFGWRAVLWAVAGFVMLGLLGLKEKKGSGLIEERKLNK